MVQVGDTVYYTGDMANDSAWLKVSCTGPTNIGMVEDGTYGGRVFNVQPSNIGDTYKGHCDPRFVTLTAYNEYKARLGSPTRAAL